jgi:hypothetical protein
LPEIAVLGSAGIAGPALAALLPLLGLAGHGFAIAGFLLAVAAVVAWAGEGVSARAVALDGGWRAGAAMLPGSLVMGLLVPELVVSGTVPQGSPLTALAAAAVPSVVGLVGLMLFALAWHSPLARRARRTPLLFAWLAAAGLAATAWLQAGEGQLLGAVSLGSAMVATWLLPLAPSTAAGGRRPLLPAVAVSLAAFAAGTLLAAPLAGLGEAVLWTLGAALIALGGLLTAACDGDDRV